jgi:3-hydroxybutyryl-CoA dehydrogenase
VTSEPKFKIGVVGGGTMGRGIVQLFAQAGYEVWCHDAAAGAARTAVSFVGEMLKRGVAKGLVKPVEFEAIVGRMHAGDRLEDLSDCGLVIEAIIEDLEVKVALFCTLENLVSDATILATNTSSLLVSSIAGGCRRPERVAGLHFFNPVPLMRIAEIIPGVRTAAATVDTLKHLIDGTGHRAVIADDQPGFLVNHAGRGLYTEGLRMLEERIADVQDIDTLLREAAGFRMGPFELLDMTGLDVSGKVMELIYAQFQQEPRFRPSSLVPPRIAAGLYGRKSGEGWYGYGQDRKSSLPAVTDEPSSSLPTGYPVWIDPAADQREALATMAAAAGAQVIDNAHSAALLIIQPWGWDASTYSAEHSLDARRCIAIDPLPGLNVRITLMLTAITETSAREAGMALLRLAGKSFTVINDSPGFVVQRVLATIVNIAANIAQRRIATVPDIEDAARLGLGYPHGPLRWGDLIGTGRILTILRNMQTVTGDPRYRPSPWLARRTLLDVSLLAPETLRS